MTKRLVTTSILAIVILAGCGTSAGQVANTGTTTSPKSASSTTVVEASGTSAGVKDCPELETPADAAKAAVAFDGDGDGKPDKLSIFKREDIWWVSVDWATGGTGQTMLNTATDLGATPLGGFDLDGDGQDEAFLSLAGPASGSVVMAFHRRDCDIVPIEVHDSELEIVKALELPITATVGTFSAAECPAEGGITHTTGELTEGDNYATTWTTYKFDPATGSATVESTATDALSVEQLVDVTGLRCGSLGEDL